MKIGILCCLLATMIVSCANNKTQKVKVSHGGDDALTYVPQKDPNLTDRQRTTEDFQPFSVERADGFYEIVKSSGSYLYKDVVLAEDPVVPKNDIAKVKAGVDDSRLFNLPVVSIELTKQGALKFEQATERNLGKPIAIVLGKKVITMPIVQGKISGGKIQISGNFSMEEAKKLEKEFNSK